MNYKLEISYCGTNYYGFAKQIDKPTIEQTFINVCKELFNLDIKIFGSGRTDRFVHALNQVINIKHCKLNIDSQALKNALNSKLPTDIFVKNCEIVDENFHARFLAKSKTYIYKLNFSPNYDPINKNLIYQYNNEINFEKLNQFASLIIGKHDFLSFSTSELQQTIRTIFDFSYEINEKILIIKITGNGFLRNMVRMIIGCFLNYNENKISISDIQNYFDNPKKGSVIRKEKGCGLYLFEVKY